MDNITLSCKRIAIKPPEESWQWYGPIVPFTVQGSLEDPPWYTANRILENMCEDVVKLHGLDWFKDKDHAKIVYAPNEQAIEKVDLEAL